MPARRLSLLASILVLWLSPSPLTTLCAQEQAAEAGYRVRKVTFGLVLSKAGKSRRLRTGLPFVEEWKFRSGGRELVVKSRARHGPALVELFEIASGRRKGKVFAYEVKDGRPPWAQGLGE